jgi:hypothetical protein
VARIAVKYNIEWKGAKNVLIIAQLVPAIGMG